MCQWNDEDEYCLGSSHPREREKKSTAWQERSPFSGRERVDVNNKECIIVHVSGGGGGVLSFFNL